MGIRAAFSDELHRSLVRKFGHDAANPIAGAQREHRRQISWNGHTRNNIDVNAAFLVKDITDCGVVFRPAELEAVLREKGPAVLGGPRERGIFLSSSFAS